MLTFIRAREKLAKYVRGGVHPMDQRCADRINLAIERLMNQKDYKHTLIRARFCGWNGFITLPRHIECIRRCRVNGFFKSIRPAWFEFMESGPGFVYDQSWLDPVDMGMYPTHFDVPEGSGDGFNIMVNSMVEEAPSASITIFGLNQYGQEVVTDGVLGETMPIRRTVGMYTKTLFTAITGVTKTKTSGHVYLSTINPDTAERFHLAEYHPFDMVPMFRRYQYGAWRSDRLVPERIEALCKLKFVEAVDDNEILLVQNEGAIQAMMQAMNCEDERDNTNAEVYDLRARKLLNEQLKNSHNTDFPEFDMQVDGFSFGKVDPV